MVEKPEKTKNKKSRKEKVKKGAKRAGAIGTGAFVALMTTSSAEAPTPKEGPTKEKKQIEASVEDVVKAKEKEVAEAASFADAQKKIEEKKEEIKEKISKGEEIEPEVEEPEESGKNLIEKKIESVKLNIANFTETLKNTFEPIVEEDATLDNLEIKSKGNTMDFTVQMTTKGIISGGIPITLTGSVVNEGSSLNLKDVDIKAKRFKKKIKEKIEPIVKDIVPAVEDSLAEEYGEIEQINIDESGNVNVIFSKR